MKLTEYSDAHGFLRSSQSYLMRSEAENNLLLSSALTIARSSSGRLPQLSYFTVEMNDQIVATAMNASHRKLLLSHAGPEAAHFLGRELARRGARVRSVFGPETASERLSEGFSAGGGALLRPEQRILQMRFQADTLENAKDPRPPAGLWRVAREKDKRLLFQWTRRFVEECRHDETREESAELVRRYIENRQLFIWEDSSAPVAMAGFSGLTPNGLRINMVYTEPKARGRGYAGALVAALNRRLLSQGDKKFCFLFVDAENQPAVRVYRRLGFETFGTFADYRDSGSSVRTTG